MYTTKIKILAHTHTHQQHTRDMHQGESSDVFCAVLLMGGRWAMMFGVFEHLNDAQNKERKFKVNPFWKEVFNTKSNNWC